MLDKPDACKGCPFYGDGKGFVPDLVNDQAEVFIVAQNPGADEERGQRFDGAKYHETPPQPLIGKTGLVMEKSFLPLAGLSRDRVSLGNAIRCRVGHKNDLPLLDHVNVREAMTHCFSAHFKLPAATKLIVTQGEYALHAMTQRGLNKYDKVGDWRGYALPFEPIVGPSSIYTDIYLPASGSSITVLSTYHLAYLLRDPTAGLVTKLDWRKIPKLLNGTWPTRLPTIQDGPPQVWPAHSAFDTEYVPDSGKFLCYSLAYPSQRNDGSLVLRVSDVLETGPALAKPHVVMQNAIADLPFLEHMVKDFSYDDIMHAHAVLWSDFPHDLGFMASLYSSLNRWKHLDKINPMVYSAGDAFATWQIYEALEKEFERDPRSANVYRNIQLRLVPIIRAAEARGVKIHTDNAKAAYEKRQTILDDLTCQAQAVVGWPINLHSNDQVKLQIYENEGLLKLI